MVKSQDYTYSLDCNSNLTNIKDAVKGNKYFCPCCGDEMIAKQGKIRKWHFTHKSKTQNCSYETYLHKLAKQRIRECFYNSKEFNIGIKTKETCGSTCLFGQMTRCKWITTKTFDLKKYYNHCNEEVSFGNFVADLAISNQKNKKPIWVEFWVTHKCTPEKINSGHRIIEIHIKSEEDIDKITSSSLIKGISHNQNSQYHSDPDIVFYNFDVENKYLTPNNTQQKTMPIIWIDDKYNLNRRIFRCLDEDLYKIDQSILYTSSDSPNPIYKFLFQAGINIRYCPMCEFYRHNNNSHHHPCSIDKTKKKECYPMPPTAMICPHFKQIDYNNITEELIVINHTLMTIHSYDNCEIRIRSDKKILFGLE